MTEKTRKVVAAAVVISLLIPFALLIPVYVIRMRVDAAVDDILSGTPVEQASALEYLANSKSPHATDALAALLWVQRYPSQMRTDVAAALGNHAVRAVAPMVLAMHEKLPGFDDLRRKGPRVPMVPRFIRLDMLDIVHRAGPAAVGPLAGLLEHPNRNVQATAAELLGATGESTVGELLVSLLNGTNVTVRKGAIRGLRELRDPAAFEALVEVSAGDPSSMCRLEAVYAFAWLHDERAFEPLLAALVKDEAENVKRAAASGLIMYSDPRAIAPLLEFAESYEGRHRSTAFYALARIEDESLLEVMLEAAGDDDARIRRCGARGLWQFEDARAFDNLVALLDDPDNTVRFVAAASLGRMKDQRAVGALEPLLDDPDLEVRVRTVEALAAIASPESLAILKPIATDPAHPLQWRAVIALEYIGTPEARAIVDEAVGDVDLEALAADYRGCIERGDHALLYPLLVAFVRYGTVEMAKDFRWSGHMRLGAEARQWARLRGFIQEIALSKDSPESPKWGRGSGGER